MPVVANDTPSIANGAGGREAEALRAVALPLSSPATPRVSTWRDHSSCSSGTTSGTAAAAAESVG